MSIFAPTYPAAFPTLTKYAGLRIDQPIYTPLKEYVISWDKSKPPKAIADGAAWMVKAELMKAISMTPTFGYSFATTPTYHCKCGKDMGPAIAGTVRRCTSCTRESAFVHDGSPTTMPPYLSPMVNLGWVLLEAR